MKKVLIMGLPGAGKTTLARKLIGMLDRANYSSYWLNADHIREMHDDWDFSIEGRIRQSTRMYELSKYRHEDFVICDFVAPLPEMRDIYEPDYLIWVDTIVEGRYKDTNVLFVPPEKLDIRVTSQKAEYWSPVIFNILV